MQKIIQGEQSAAANFPFSFIVTLFFFLERRPFPPTADFLFLWGLSLWVFLFSAVYAVSQHYCTTTSAAAAAAVSPEFPLLLILRSCTLKNVSTGPEKDPDPIRARWGLTPGHPRNDGGIRNRWARRSSFAIQTRFVYFFLSLFPSFRSPHITPLPLVSAASQRLKASFWIWKHTFSSGKWELQEWHADEVRIKLP